MQNGKQCPYCGKKLADSAYFNSSNAKHKDGLTPICKKCFAKNSIDNDGQGVDLARFQHMLQVCDKPFRPEIYKAAMLQAGKNEGKSGIAFVKAMIGYYFAKLNLTQYKDLTWDNSKFDDRDENESVKTTRAKGSNKRFSLNDDSFNVTEEMIRLFGEGYTAKEYEIMQRIYDDMQQEYPNISSSQRNLLLRYVRFATKEEIATANNIPGEAEKWSKMATDALKQLNAVDTQGGISSFSEFFRDFERVKDVSRILPKFKYRPNDAPDFIIWCYINYCRRLEGKPEVEYSEIYKFYDEKIDDYLKQYGDPYGIFKDDPTKQNREKIKEFIKLPPDYDSLDG